MWRLPRGQRAGISPGLPRGFPFLMGFSSSGGAWSPATLFAGGENGVWYEPSTTTAFRSTTDLTPCAVGQSCGFLLDKSQGAGYSGGSFTGLGENMLSGDAASDDTNSVGDWLEYNLDTTVSVESSNVYDGSYALKIEGTAETASSGYLDLDALGLTAGAHYVIEGYLKVSLGTSNNVRLSIDDNPIAYNAAFRITTLSADQDYTKFQAVFREGVGRYLLLRTAGTFSGYIDGLSIRKLPGNHATQGTAPARPIYRETAGGLPYLEFDTVDDWIGVTASVLGTGMTAYTMLVAFELRSESNVDGIAGFTDGGYSAGDSLSLLRNRDSAGIDFESWFPQGTNEFSPAAQASSTSTPYLALFTSTNGAQSARLNGSEYATGTAAHAASTPAEFTLGAYSRSGLSAGEVNIYGALLIDRVLTGDEIASLEAHAAALSGVTL